MFNLPVNPVSKPRMTQSDKWKYRKSTSKYWAYKHELIYTCELLNYQPSTEIKIIFYIAMPNSWSNKKKQDYAGRPHQNKPDIDNLVKAFLDALLPEDKIVWHIEAYKFWATVGSIKVENL